MMKGLSWLKRLSPFLVFALGAFCATLLPPQLPVTTFGIVAPNNLRPMTVTGILPGDVVIALAFAAAAVVAAASTFVGGGVGICDIVASLGKSWVVIKLCKY